MIAADDKNLLIELRQLVQESVEQLNSLSGRDRFVVNVPCQDDAVWLLLPSNTDNLL